MTEEFGITPRALRCYEAQGLLTPERRGRRRLYAPRDRTRLKLILRGKRLGFSLAEIKDIVPMYDEPAGEEGQLRLLLETIAARRMELLQKRQDIEDTLEEMDAVETISRHRMAELNRRRA